METESEQNSGSTNGASASGGSSRPQISQMSLYERQAVQALQALHRQPNAAQYFHQLMLQQQLSNAQLHSLAAVQQATIAASRQAASPNTGSAQQTSTTQGSASLSTSSSAQLLNRAQNVTAPSATTLTQSVLLSNASSPPLSQSQTQMYLRQQPQLGNLLQVNRSLGRGVPLNSQLVLMPNELTAHAWELTAHAWELTTHAWEPTAHAWELTAHAWELTAHAWEPTAHTWELTAHVNLRPMSTPGPCQLTAHVNSQPMA
ncbi:polyhomeotic-like protein 1 [Rhinophrynus dorsalis]